MVALSTHSLLTLSSPLFHSTSHRFPSSTRTPTRPSSVRASMERSRPDFPHFPPAPRALMLNLLATINDGLGSALLPSGVPPDILHFQNPQGSAYGSIDIRTGSQPSQIDFMLESWLHCRIPGGGGEVNIGNLLAFLNTSTDAPHLLIELVQSNPTSLILFIDLLPRKDLVLHPDYLHEFYHQTNLDGPRIALEQLPQASPYRPSALFVRSIFSPVAVSINIEGEAGTVEDIVAEQINSAAKKIVGIWLEKCAVASRQMVAEGEKELLERRDELIKRKAVEIDLVENLPRMFGPEVANRVVGEIQKAFRV